MSRRLVRAALAIVPMLPHVASAQGPWAAVLSMSRPAVGTGECNAVSLDLKDASGKEWPRGPNGNRVSLADFDLTVSAPVERAAVAQYDGPTSFAVCACPRAPAGTVATVTATYPARFIAPRARVAGVQFAVTMRAPIAAHASSGNPPGCDPPTPTTALEDGRAVWTVTLAPPISLPIGSCGPVQLTLRDSTGKDWPRNALGTRVSLADFDLSATAANGPDVVGTYDGAGSFSVCACQSATVGEAASVTATYPARSLAAKARVAGVALRARGPLTLATARGSANPPACGQVQATQVVAAGGGAAAAAGGGAAAGGAAAASSGAAAAVGGDAQGAAAGASSENAAGGAAAAHQEQEQTTSKASGEAAKGGAAEGASGAGAPQRLAATTPALEAPIASAPASGKSLIPHAGEAPSGLTVTGTPLVAHLSWHATPKATRYALWRGTATVLSVERTPPAFTATAFEDTVQSPLESYRYSVIAYYADGTKGESNAVSFTSPPLANPSGFSATSLGGGAVRLDWQPVPAAVRYRIDGSGIPVSGMMHNGSTTITLYQVPSGPDSWKIRTMYAGDVSDSTTAAVATAMLRAAPPHPLQWLTKNNGAGNSALASVHYSTLCPPTIPDCFTALESVVTSKQFGADDIPFWGDPTGKRLAEEAVYGNVTDLGFGRRTNCSQVMKGPPVPGPVTMCYATSHGPGPGESGFANPQTITRAAAGELAPVQNGSQAMSKNPWGDAPRSGTVIIKDAAGSFYFYAFTPGQWDLREDTQDAFYNKWIVTPGLQASLTFDSEGAKSAPHSCLSCHGGQWNAATHRVTGASFLPLDPSVLVFGTNQPNDRANYTRSGQEENIRRINQIIASSSPGSAVAAYINGLYNGSVHTKGAVARTDYVPSGWSAQTGFYLSTVRPYCTSCHLAAPAAINFSSWGNFQQNKAEIYNAVCVAHTMPHAEIPYRGFWTRDTGALYLPGLLAATLGYPSC